MNPDLEKRVPREILAELIEEGTEAFRGILEKLFNVAMQLERSEFLRKRTREQPVGEASTHRPLTSERAWRLSATDSMCGLEISATQVSRVAGMLDEELGLESTHRVGAGGILIVELLSGDPPHSRINR